MEPKGHPLFILVPPWIPVDFIPEGEGWGEGNEPSDSIAREVSRQTFFNSVVAMRGSRRFWYHEMAIKS